MLEVEGQATLSVCLGGPCWIEARGEMGGSGGWKKNLRGSGAGMGVSNAPSSQAPGNTFDLCATWYYPAKGDPRTSPDL